VTCSYLLSGARMLSIDMMGWKGDNKFIEGYGFIWFRYWLIKIFCLKNDLKLVLDDIVANEIADVPYSCIQ
jgi:hypothetical protein